jgi:sugar lactone lactonase YvrE
MKPTFGVLMLSAAVCFGQGTISTYAIPGTTGANGLAFDAQGNLYYSWVAEAKIIKVSTSGTAIRIAGNGNFGFAGDGGPATSAMLMTLAGVAVDSAGNVYFSDSGNHVIRKISATGIISTFAGTPQVAGLPVEKVPATSVLSEKYV